jgi:hypothetical protein
VTERRFRHAALAYLAYGLVYYVGGLYLVSQGVGVMGAMEGRTGRSLAFWAVAGLVPLLVVPYLLSARRGWFERWVLARRDFARVVALFLAFRAFKVAQVALGDHGASVAAPWGGAVSFGTGAALFLVITLVALAAIVRAAWAKERPVRPETRSARV